MRSRNPQSLSSRLAVLAAVAALAPASAEIAPQLTDELERHLLRPIPAPVAAPDFELAALDGSTRSLADWRGSWVLLNFWATWCGPCRAEMPALDRLHRDDRLAVVTVAVDRDREAIERFVARYELDLPVLHDSDGAIATVYRAESIPLSYLVDPLGRLVAVARGARDWEAMESLWSALGAATSGAQGVAETARGEEPAKLPAVFDPPRADYRLSTTTPTLGAEFHLDVRVEWAGGFDEYLLHPPTVHLPEGIERRGITASTSSRDGSSVVNYRVALAGAQSGRFRLDPVEIVYTPRSEAVPVARRVGGPEVEVVPRRWLGMAPPAAVVGAGGVLALLAGVALAARRRRRPAAVGDERDRAEALGAILERARRRRLDGDPAGAVAALAEIERRLGLEPADRAIDERVEEEARYGGRAPDVFELEGIERRLAGRIAELADRGRRRRSFAARDTHGARYGHR